MCIRDRKVTIDKSSGFCFCIVYAIDMSEDILDHEEYLYCLGDIVHNDEEVLRLKAKGLRIIDHDKLHELKNEKILIRAHGEAPSTYELALNNNLTLIDASCPVVLKLQNRIKNSYDDDEQILIFGKHGPVSYTHLDVYKRQIRYLFLIKNKSIKKLTELLIKFWKII